MVIGRHVGGALVDNARAGLQIEVDPLAHQPVLTIEEHRPALGDGLASGAVELDPIGDQTVIPAGDLDVARGQKEAAFAPALLHAIPNYLRLTPLPPP